jgi:hypothetical protein
MASGTQGNLSGHFGSDHLESNAGSIKTPAGWHAGLHSLLCP